MWAEPFWRIVKGKYWHAAKNQSSSAKKFIWHNFKFSTYRFAINLTLGHLHNDIALHINPRLPQNYIVRNTKINGRWGKEETTASLPFKLKRDERFAIQILVTESTYLISVNGLHFTTFAHRIPFDRVTCVQLVGDVVEGDIEHLPIKVKTNNSVILRLLLMSRDWFIDFKWTCDNWV